MCEAILEAALRRAEGRRVTRVRVRVGAMHRVVEPAFDQSFSHVAEGTPAEGAAVDLVVIPVRLKCRTCGSESESADGLPLCGHCDSADVVLVGGDELVLESIEVVAPA